MPESLRVPSDPTVRSARTADLTAARTYGDLSAPPPGPPIRPLAPSAARFRPRMPPPPGWRRGERPGNGYHGPRGRALVRPRPVPCQTPVGSGFSGRPDPDEEVRVS